MDWYEQFNRLAGDLYPDHYTKAYVTDLAATAREVGALARQKRSLIVAHNYVYPELQEVADAVGDSLGLSQFVARKMPPRVDFCGVWFMGETAKIIAGNRSRVYMPDRAGCSLAESVQERNITLWRASHPNGIVITYVNSDARAKAISNYVCTSGNAAKVVRHATSIYPGRPILFLPDKYLGAVAMAQAEVPPGLFQLHDGSCHVHAAIDGDALEAALERRPSAEPLIHPECACVKSHLSPRAGGGIRSLRIRFLSTEQMLRRARQSLVAEG